MVFVRSAEGLTVEEGVVEETLKLFGVEFPVLKIERNIMYLETIQTDGVIDRERTWLKVSVYGQI